MIEKNRDFQEIYEIINRFETLHANRIDLHKRQQENEKFFLKERKDFYNYQHVSCFAMF